MRILHYPFISTQQELDALYHRACWYLPDMQGHTVVFPFHAAPLGPGQRPSAFGVDATPEFDIEFPVARDNPEAMALLNRADVILLWRDNLNKMERYNLSGLSKRIFNTSNASEEWRLEAYHSAILRHELMPAEERRELVTANHQKLQRLIPELSTATAYVFGTGPSLEEALHMPLDDGLRIVCNTTVRNDPLMERLAPQVIVAADPALHYGVSRYAAAFRDCLVRAMRRFGSHLLLPMGYYPLFVKRYPEFAHRTIGVPVVPARPENVSVDLAQSFQVACYANVLTMFLLPVGATLAKEVRIVGCDGRDPAPRADDGNPSPFWTHQKESEFEELYDTLKQCHPSFFHRDYADWYDDHCRGVGIVVDKAEEAGRIVRTMTRSFIPSLTRRLPEPLRHTCQAALDNATAESGEDEFVHDTRTRQQYRVSVFVSLYNAERFMAPMLQNLFAQTLYRTGELEIILIDSNSPTREKEVFLALAAHQPHVLYKRTRARETVYGAFNRGVREARGRYVMNLGSDNRFRPDAAEVFAQALDSHPEVGLVYGNHFVSLFDNDGFHDHVRFGRLWRPRFSRDMMLHKFYFGSEMMWRKSLHDEVGYYDDSFVVAGDYDLVCRFARVTEFLHVDRYFGLYQKNLVGVEFSNLELCRKEDDRIRKAYASDFPAPVDPPRVHVHYPTAPDWPQDYLTIVCHSMSFDKPVTRSVMKIVENLEYPFILYCVDQNSSQATRDSIAYLEGEGYAVSPDNLTPAARALFEARIAYQPTLKICLLAHGETRLMDKDFMAMSRPQLTAYFRDAHRDMTRHLRTASGGIDPVKVRSFCDHHEFERLDIGPHLAADTSAVSSRLDGADLTVFIQHYAPAGQEDKFRGALKRCIASVRAQQHGASVRIVVSDDGSPWSSELAGNDPDRLIAVHDRDSLKTRPAFADIDADIYLYKPRTGYFSKGILWNAAVRLTNPARLLFLDDDHHFIRQDSLARYMDLLDRYELVVGNTLAYSFRDIDGVHHDLKLGYHSRVVQGSNFAMRRDLFDAIGGFEPRTFFWGTGDDPVLFWKLYQLLGPSGGKAGNRACYAEAIMTENPYSGRWRDDCRVDIEMFTRDFLRLFGTHPNSNPSRDRTTWMDLDAMPETVHKPSPQPESQPRCLEPALQIVVPVAGHSLEAVWHTVAGLIDQRLPEPHAVVVAATREFAARHGDMLPRGCRLEIVDASNPGHCVAKALENNPSRHAGWIMPGIIPLEKLLKGALTLLRESGADIVYGRGCRMRADGLRIDHVMTPPLTPDSCLSLLSLWQPGQPVFGKRDTLLGLLPDTTRDCFDLELLLAALGMGLGIMAKEQLFSLHPHGSPTLGEATAADLFAGVSEPLAKAATLGAIKALAQERCPSDAHAESNRIVPWVKAVESRLGFVLNTAKALAQEAGNGRGALSTALWGSADSARALIPLLPSRFEPTAVVDDGGQTAETDRMPVVPSAKAASLTPDVWFPVNIAARETLAAHQETLGIARTQS